MIELINKIKFWRTTDRIGPDVPWTHWRLYLKSTMLKLCRKKFFYFGENAEIRPGAYIVGCSQISIGNRVIIRPTCMLFGETNDNIPISIMIEDDVMLGAGVHIYTNNHKFERLDISLIDQGYYPDKQVVLKKGCWVGANVIILPGVEIGENAVVGAGSIVTKTVIAGSIVGGNPAKLLKIISPKQTS